MPTDRAPRELALEDAIERVTAALEAAEAKCSRIAIEALTAATQAKAAREELEAAERRVAELERKVESVERWHASDLEDIAEEYGVTGPHIYDGCWHPRIPGTNVHVKHFKQNREACEAWIAEWNAKNVEHSEGGWPDRALKAERRVGEAVAAEREAIAAFVEAAVVLHTADGDRVITDKHGRSASMAAIAAAIRARATPAGQGE